MQSNAVEHAHLETTCKGPATHATGPRWQGDSADFLHQSHRVAERAASFLMGVTAATLAMYNIALWMMR